MRAFSPVGYVIGRLTAALGVTMLVPAALDLADGHAGWRGTGLAAFLTVAAGLSLSVLNASERRSALSRHQAILLTVLLWVLLPVFGALPFVFGAPHASYTDAFFEAMSGLTTTGATVFEGLDTSPRGMLLWRAMLQWFGGVGIVVFAMVFLPVMKIGGMQFFRSEAFDLDADILPRAAEVAGQLGLIYLGLSIACVLGYSAAGMSAFDAISHMMTTVSTGGMGNYDIGFDKFSDAAHYVAIVFMWLAAWPFIHFFQLVRGNHLPLWRDAQIRAFLVIIVTVSGAMTVWLIAKNLHAPLDAVREALFNATAAMTGTGYASDDYSSWGGFPVALFFIMMLVGGCTGSTSCSAKIFRYQILIAALRVQLRRIHSPHGVFSLHYQGRNVDAEILSSVMGYFLVFAAALATWAILLSLTGLDAMTSMSGAVASLANVGPGLGTMIGPAGNYAEVGTAAKWILSAGMLLGRLEFMSVLVLLMPLFWRR